MTLNSEAVKIQIARWEDELRQMVHDEEICLLPVKRQEAPLSLEELAEVVCHVTGLQAYQLKSKNRKREYVTARQLVCYFGYQRFRTTWKALGIFLGGRDHSTTLTGYKRHKDLLDSGDQAAVNLTMQVQQYLEAIQKRLKEQN